MDIAWDFVSQKHNDPLASVRARVAAVALISSIAKFAIGPDMQWRMSP